MRINRCNRKILVNSPQYDLGQTQRNAGGELVEKHIEGVEGGFVAAAELQHVRIDRVWQHGPRQEKGAGHYDSRNQHEYVDEGGMHVFGQEGGHEEKREVDLDKGERKLLSFQWLIHVTSAIINGRSINVHLTVIYCSISIIQITAQLLICVYVRNAADFKSC